jgi:hypothetical protein
MESLQEIVLQSCFGGGKNQRLNPQSLKSNCMSPENDNDGSISKYVVRI